MGVPTGADTRLNIQYEDTSSYKSADSNRDPFVPGANTTLDRREATNNGTRITLPASKTTVAIEPGTFEGAWAISGALTNPWLFESIYGAPNTTDNADGSYTHAYSNVDVASFQTLIGYETSTTAESTLQGCVPARLVLDPTVGEDGVVPFTWEGFYAVEDTTTGGSLTSQDTLDEDTFDYGDARLDVDGTTQAIVQDASLELAINPIEAIQGFGSRFAIDYLSGLFEPTIDYTKIKQDSKSLQRVYGGATTMQEDVADDDPLTLDFDNGVSAGNGINQITLNGSGGFPESYSDSGGDPRQAIEEELNDMLQGVSADATNETATPP